MTVPVLVQFNSGVAATGNPVSVTFSSPNTSGNFLVAYCSSGSSGSTFTVSDGTNGRYMRLVQGGAGSNALAIYITPIATPAVNNSGQGVTVTMTPSSSVNPSLTIEEWSGIDATSPTFMLDQVLSPVSGTSTTPSAGTFGTLAENGELVLVHARAAVSVTWTAGSGFTLDGTAQPRGNQAQYGVVSDNTGPTASFTISSSQAWTACAVALRSSKSRKVISLTSGTTFSAPADWPGTADRVDAIGGGGAGRNANSASSEGSGGGGGAYTYAYNVAISNGSSMQIGAGGSTNAAAGTDTWIVSTGTIRAKGGAGGAISNPGLGGSASSCVPAANAFSGGNGGTYAASGTCGAGGGGGAAGPYGAGSNGGTQNATGVTGGTGGGGGGGTGSAAGTAQSGSNQAGTAGGTGGWYPGASASGTAGTGGNGGASGVNNGSSGSSVFLSGLLSLGGSSGGGGGGGGSDGSGGGGGGGVGGNGVEWLLTDGTNAGAGGGGGGNGEITSGSANPPGNGGLYGGGGAGGGNGTYTAFGSGANGVLVITYTPALLLGQTITTTESNLGENVGYSTTAQSASFVEGTVGRDLAPNLGSITATFGEGNILFGQNLTGQTIASSEGTIMASLSGDFTTSLSAQTAGFAQGQLFDNIGYLLDQNGVILVGQTAIFQEGFIGLERDASLTAFTVSSTEGTITNSVTISLTALNIVSLEGSITATAGNNQNIVLGNLFINSVLGTIGLESDHALTAQSISSSIGTITFSIEFHSFLLTALTITSSEGVMVAVGPAQGTGPPLFIPPQLGKPVTTRTFSWSDMAQRAWGSEFRAPDHRIYQFSGGNYKDSTDMGTTGIYSPNLGTPDNPPPNP